MAVAPRERRQKAVEGKKEERKTMIDDAEDLNASMSTTIGIGSVVVNNYSSTGGGNNDATMMILFTTLFVIVIGITIQGYIKSIIQVRYWLDIFNRCNMPGPTLDNHPYSYLADLGTILNLDLTPHVNPKDRMRNTLPYFQKLSQTHAKDSGIHYLWIFHPYRFLTNLFCKPLILIYDPVIIKQILGNKAFGLYNRSSMFRSAKDLVGDSFLAENDTSLKWKHQRKMVTQGFNNVAINKTTNVVYRLLHNHLFPINNLDNLQYLNSIFFQYPISEIPKRHFHLEQL